MRRVVLTAVLGLALMVPAAALAASLLVTREASGGGVTATLSYTTRQHGLFASGARITVRANGRQVYAGAVSKPHCGNYCQFFTRPLTVRELDGQADPVLITFTGGAHCCSYVDVYSRSAAGHWTDTGFNFGDPGVALEHIGPGGQVEFVSGNDAFAYAFTDYAESGMPLMILSFTGGRFTDVTRSYPALIRKDAKLMWRGYQRDHTKGAIGLIAAWAADEDNLGHRAAVSAMLTRQADAHRITAAGARHLRAFLTKLGCTH